MLSGLAKDINPAAEPQNEQRPQAATALASPPPISLRLRIACLGHLWQTLILSRWKPELAFLPVESVIRERLAEYYAALAASDKAGQSTIFIEFIFSALLQALR